MEGKFAARSLCGSVHFAFCCANMVVRRELRERAVFLSVGVYANSSSRMEPDGFCARVPPGVVLLVGRAC